MAVILAANYPELFRGVASASGIGYGAATNVMGALAAMAGNAQGLARGSVRGRSAGRRFLGRRLLGVRETARAERQADQPPGEVQPPHASAFRSLRRREKATAGTRGPHPWAGLLARGLRPRRTARLPEGLLRLPPASRPEWRLPRTPSLLSGLPGHSGGTAPDSHRLPS